MDLTLEQILAKRNEFEYGTEDWFIWNEKKAELLEAKKPSVAENIITFNEDDLAFLPEGFIRSTDEIYNKLMNTPVYISRRSLLEYVDEQRHPIPYVYIRNGENIFFISREGGSGEQRLVGKKGMLGGHVGDEDFTEGNLHETLRLGMLRELEEEAGIKESQILDIKLQGLIKSNDGVDSDHLGLVYEVTLDSNDIETQEEGVISGLWLNLDEIKEHYDSFESWSRIVIDNLFLKETVK